MEPGDASAVDPTQSSPVRHRAALQPSRIAPGTRVGRFAVLEFLGAGAMGAVYGAYDPHLDRQVALKLLPAHGATTPEADARLRREAVALARLAHPNIVAVHEVGSWEGGTFVAMELVRGLTLRRWLDERPRTWQEVVRVFAEAGRGLAAAHAAGLVHRDFKPDNVLVSPDGRVRVADFGLARAVADSAAAVASGVALDSAVDQTAASWTATAPAAAPHGERADGDLAAPLSRTGAIVGTPAYMAPEQLAAAPVDAQSDQFSFCVAFYEAICGQRPFPARTLDDLRGAHGRARVELPAGCAAPAWVGDLLRRGLALRPEDRFPSLAELLARLPADPEADPRGSDRIRALFIGTIGLLQIGAVLYFLRYHGPAGGLSAPQRLGGLVAWAALTLVIGGAFALLCRRSLLGNRISRQIFVAFGVIYYTSLLGEFAGSHLGASDAAVSVLSLLWGGACLLLLGVALRRLFLVPGAIVLAAGCLALLRPAQAVVVGHLTPFAVILLSVIAWTRRREAEGATAHRGRGGRRPKAASQR